MAAFLWAAKWYLQLQDSGVSESAVVFTDCQFVVDTWDNKPLAAFDMASNMPDLEEQLVWPEGIEARKVKAHNKAGLAQGVDAYTPWTTLGNEMADWAAKNAKQQEVSFLREYSDPTAEWRLGNPSTKPYKGAAQQNFSTVLMTIRRYS